MILSIILLSRKKVRYSISDFKRNKFARMVGIPTYQETFLETRKNEIGLNESSSLLQHKIFWLNTS